MPEDMAMVGRGNLEASSLVSKRHFICRRRATIRKSALTPAEVGAKPRHELIVNITALSTLAAAPS